ncbi:hypothetical protein PV325_013686, partial [Microctonus aethiopoides]
MTSLTQIVTYAASASVSASVELDLESKHKPSSIPPANVTSKRSSLRMENWRLYYLVNAP